MRQKKKRMTFVNGIAKFVGKYKQLICYPLGGPHNMIVGEGSSREVIITPKPTVHFVDNKYQTDDQEITIGMMEYPGRFGNPWGWTFEDECLPVEIRKVFGALTREQKIEVGLKLAESTPPEKVLASIPPALIEEAKELASARPAAYHSICPSPNCGLSIGGNDITPQEAQKAMGEHVRLAHPNFTAS